MKKFKFYIAGLCFLFHVPAFSQVQIDHPLQLTGSGPDAKITGIQSVTNAQDAASVQSIQNGSFIYAVDAGSNNNFAITISPAITSYAAGMVFNFISNQTVTGPATLNVNNLGAKPITKYINQAFTGCEIQTGQIVTVVYDGTNFQITSVFSSVPATPGAISGSDTVCGNFTDIVYTINPVNGATGYQWQYTGAGLTITSGLNTNSITVSFSNAATSGTLSVSATNACGAGTSSSAFAITVISTPAAPAAPTGPASIGTLSTGNVYSVAPVGGATSYTWTVPSSVGTIISGQGGTSITVTGASSGGTGNITVAAVNATCPSAASTPLSVTVLATAPIYLDQSASSNGGTSFNISTTNANELIMVAANGCCPQTPNPTVTVDGNTATLILEDGTNGADVAVYAYLASSSGSHTINVSENGYSSPYYINLAASFTGGISLSPAKTIAVSAGSLGSSAVSASVITPNANNYLFAASLWAENTSNVITFSGAINSVLASDQHGSGVAGGIGAAPAAMANTYTVTAGGCCSVTSEFILVAIQP